MLRPSLSHTHEHTLVQPQGTQTTPTSPNESCCAALRCPAWRWLPGPAWRNRKLHTSCRRRGRGNSRRNGRGRARTRGIDVCAHTHQSKKKSVAAATHTSNCDSSNGTSLRGAGARAARERRRVRAARRPLAIEIFSLT